MDKITGGLSIEFNLIIHTLDSVNEKLAELFQKEQNWNNKPSYVRLNEHLTFKKNYLILVPDIVSTFPEVPQKLKNQIDSNQNRFFNSI